MESNETLERLTEAKSLAIMKVMSVNQLPSLCKLRSTAKRSCAAAVSKSENESDPEFAANTPGAITPFVVHVRSLAVLPLTVRPSKSVERITVALAAELARIPVTNNALLHNFLKFITTVP